MSERLSQRGAADLNAVRKITLAQPVAGLDLAGKTFRPERVIGDLA